MLEGIDTEIVGGVIAAAIVGLGSAVGGFVYRGWRSKRLLERQMRRNPDEFAGRWYGCHVTRKGRQKVLSRHVYDLVVKDCFLTGTFTELAGEGPYRFEVQGDFSPPNLILRAYADFTAETSVALVFNTTEQTIMYGLYSAHDFDKNPIAGPIVISRRELTDDEAIEIISRYKDAWVAKI